MGRARGLPKRCFSFEDKDYWEPVNQDLDARPKLLLQSEIGIVKLNWIS